MLFNSTVFLIFFVAVYTLYLLSMRRHQVQNILLLVASYFFYGWWDWRFLVLIMLSTLVDYNIGLRLENTPNETASNRRKRTWLLIFSVVVNLGILGFFKYYNFFVDGFVDLVSIFGITPNLPLLNIALPVGISFYTFQTMSYTIDIYRERLAPTHSLLNFATFVSFFPQLVAGPIERAATFLPQIERPRQIQSHQIATGMYLILWGLTKKVAIADRAGVIANTVFNNYQDYSGIDLIIGILAFAIQIYGDFSGYTDMARGIARLMGFELMLNFRLPYFAVSPSDFWNRWHISLSTWLRDYLYIPLGGNQRGVVITYRNLMITMILGGLWHGAAWNFVIWGVYHGAILVLFRIFDRRPIDTDPWHLASPFVVILRMSFMFALTLVGWLIFRSQSLDQILYMISHVSLAFSTSTVALFTETIAAALPLVLIDLWQYWRGNLLALPNLRLPVRIIVYGVLVSWCLVFAVRTSIEFVYFQF